MAKISTYPVLSTPTLNDLLIGTDVEDFNKTKNFLISDIADFILADNYVPYLGADKNLNLGIHSVIANSFIVNGGTASDFLKADGTLDSTVYQPAGNYITQLSGEATASGPGNAAVTLNNAAVIGKVLTGLSITGNVITASDSILTAFGKVQNQINTLVGGVQYQGTWNAATNTPTLVSSVGVQGYYFVVSVDGNTNLNGITDWKLGDWAIFNGSAWEKVDNTDAVISVNGQIGEVVLTTTNIAEGTNLYYTDARSRNAISLTTNGNNGLSTYNNATGVINVPGYTLAGLAGVPLTRQITINGVAQDLSADRTYNVGTVTSVATTAPLTGGTITGAGTLGITQSGAASDGYLSSTDWNTFNNKQNVIVNPVTGTGTALTLPMWGSASSLVNSPLSFLSDAFTFQYNSLTGATVVFTNTGLTTYTYSIQMNNFGSPRSTIHNYTDGIVIHSIAGVQTSTVFANGNTIFGVGLADNGHKLELEGSLKVDTIANATTDTDRFLVSDSGVIKYRTGAELLSDIGGVPSSRTLTINGVTQDLSADRTFTIATHDAVTIGTANGLSLIGQQLSLGLASGSDNGALSSADWSTFNSKQDAGNYITSLTNEVTASGPGAASATLLNSAVIGKVLTGLNLTGGGTITATDSILQAFGKTQNQISALVGGVMYEGVWNASTNTPTITSSVGTKGEYYVVNVAGSTNIDGITDWEVGDWIIFNGTTWDKVDNTDAVSSVNGFTGAVNLTTANIAEVTNLYYTDARARAAISLTTSGSSGASTYNSSTGVLNIPNYNPDLTGFVTLDTVQTITAQKTFTTSGGDDTLIVNHTSGSGIALDIAKAGNGEGLRVAKSSGTGNAVTITGGNLEAPTIVKTGGTSSQFLKADGSVDSTAYYPNSNPSGFTSNVGTVTSVSASAPLASSGGNTPNLTITQASGSTNGFLSSTDWNTFNNKQNTLTNPVTGTGTTNFLPKFTGTSTIGNSLIFDNGTNVLIGTTATPTPVLGVAFPFSVTSAATTRIRIDSTQATPNSGVGLYANGVQKFSFAMFGATSDFTIYNDALTTPALLVKGNTNNILIGNPPNDNLARLQVVGGGTFTLGISALAYIANVQSTYSSLTYEHTFQYGSTPAGLWFGNSFNSNNNVGLQIRTSNDGTVQTALTLSPTGAATFTGALNGTSASFTGDLTVDTNTLYVDSANNSVGIGTLIPKFQSFNRELTVSGGVSGTSRGAINIQGSRTTNSTFASFAFYHQTNYVAGIESSRAGADNSGNLQFFTTNAGVTGERLTLASTGAATFSSSAVGVATFNSTFGQMFISMANNGVNFGGIGSGNSVTSDGAAADDLGIGTGGLNKNIVFATGTGFTRRMTITSGGNVLIGTTTDVAGANLNVNGNIRTAAPFGYSAANWKLGTASSGSQPSETHQIIVEIAGQLYSIGAALL